MKRSSKAALALVIVAVASNAGADTFKPSRGQQVDLGLRAAADLRHKEKVLPASDERVQMLRRIGDRLLATFTEAKDKEWKYSFDVIQSKELNAFALPGGPVFFYSGLMDKLRTEDQIAGVLAHELTHVRREHWAYAYRDSQKANLLLTLGLILGKADNNTAQLASVGYDVFVGLKYSRAHESEADNYGFDTMVKAGYNPEAMADVFRIFAKQSGSKSPEFFSDHPDDKRRINNIEDKVKKSGKTFPAQRPLPWVREE